jgi:copper chaperone CopZ
VTRTELLIAGMQDNQCREAIAAALELVDGVKEVDVNLYRARATIIHASPCTVADLITAVARAGFGAAPPFDRSAQGDGKTRRHGIPKETQE